MPSAGTMKCTRLSDGFAKRSNSKLKIPAVPLNDNSAAATKGAKLSAQGRGTSKSPPGQRALVMRCRLLIHGSRAYSTDPIKIYTTFKHASLEVQRDSLLCAWPAFSGEREGAIHLGEM